jgi:hypothetical protein
MHPRTLRTPPFRTLLALAVAATVATVGQTAPAPQERDRITLAASSNPVTPGNFTGYGFDQCDTVSQQKMDAWLKSSPFLGVGVYISGASRACRTQSNLTPTWVSTQLRNGWKLLPITLGPQASCSERYPRYGASIDPVISASTTDSYAKAKSQGRLEAERAVAAASKLGIVPGSTLYYDLENFDITKTTCRESALRFVHAWTNRLHELNYLSGFYSSAASGIKMIDNVRINRPGVFSLPDQLWIARWDGVANTSTTYISDEGWNPHRRVKQYQGGHDETWGGETINIDRNYLDVGKGSVAASETHCNGVRVDWATYPKVVLHEPNRAMVSTLQCLLKEQGAWDGGLAGWYGKRLQKAIAAWQTAHGFAVTTTWSRGHWVSLHAQGTERVLKTGSAGSAVRRLQRALVANGARLAITGVFTAPTDSALRAWQKKLGLNQSGVAAATTWKYLRLGR